MTCTVTRLEARLPDVERRETIAHTIAHPATVHRARPAGFRLPPVARSSPVCLCNAVAGRCLALPKTDKQTEDVQLAA